MWRAAPAEARGEWRPTMQRAGGRDAAEDGKQAQTSGEGRMSAITLAQAERIIDAVIERGVALNCRPLSVIVVEPGCKVKAFKKEDGASMIRFEMAYGKAYAALVAWPQLEAGARARRGAADLHALSDRRERRADFSRRRRHADPRRPRRGHRRGRRDRRYRGPRRGARDPRHPRRGIEDRRGLRRHGPAYRLVLPNANASCNDNEAI